MKAEGVFITGTDTGVGKTFLGVGLAEALSAQGISVGAMKPVETGCIARGGRLLPQDARVLAKASGANDPLDLVNPYRFLPPVAPLVAAEQAGQTISLARIMAAYRALRRRHDFLIVEGAGGIMVPLSSRRSYLDLARMMALPVLVVARPGLGTINHAVLTVMALRSQNIPVARIVVNHSTREQKGLSVRTNPAVIERLTGVPVTVMPYGGDQGLLARSLSRYRHR